MVRGPGQGSGPIGPAEHRQISRNVAVSHRAGDPRLFHVGISAITTHTESTQRAKHRKQAPEASKLELKKIQKPLGFIPKPRAKNAGLRPGRESMRTLREGNR